MKNKLYRLYRYLRYGERSTCKTFISKLVECQDLYTADIYDCSNCGMIEICFEDGNERFMRYLKRNDLYKEGVIRRMDDVSTYPAEVQKEIAQYRDM